MSDDSEYSTEPRITVGEDGTVYVDMDGTPIEVQVPVAEPSPIFDWTTAFDLMDKRGPEVAMVLGLSMISEQLDFIARKDK